MTTLLGKRYVTGRVTLSPSGSLYAGVRDSARVLSPRPVHLGIYRFAGDPGTLLPAYERLMASMPPGQVVWHLCAVAPDGIVVYDTCPSEEVFRAFIGGGAFREAVRRAGLPEPDVEGLPVHTARGPQVS
jgi:hypothetical protein